MHACMHVHCTAGALIPTMCTSLLYMHQLISDLSYCAKYMNPMSTYLGYVVYVLPVYWRSCFGSAAYVVMFTNSFTLRSAQLVLENLMIPPPLPTIHSLPGFSLGSLPLSRYLCCHPACHSCISQTPLNSHSTPPAARWETDVCSLSYFLGL